MRKYASLVITFVVIALCMPIALASVSEIAKYLGLRQSIVPVVGTGSMYPSLFWEKSEGGPDDSSKMSVEEYRTTPHMYHRFTGLTIFGKTYFRRTVAYGDMVAFQNDKTKAILSKENKDASAGFIKRVIGVPGDTIELRDGYVIRNGEQLSEPYIYKPRSTYGDSFLPDCKKLTIPDNSYLVLGDNRKISSDSRGELGLITDQNISFVLPYNEQSVYHSLYRDTSHDAELSGKPTLVASDFYTLVNKTRSDKKVNPLKASSLLARSSSIRGSAYLDNKNIDMKAAMSSAGYSNIVTGEFVTPGHFTADELLQNLLYFADTSKQLLDPQYQEIGVAAVTKEVNGCPVQVIVGHLGGYIPASYDHATVDGWTKLSENLEKVVPTWEKAVGVDGVDQSKLQSLLTILHRRLTLAREIEGVMRDNKWLTDEQQARIKADEADANQAEQLAKDLNGG